MADRKEYHKQYYIKHKEKKIQHQAYIKKKEESLDYQKIYREKKKLDKHTARHKELLNSLNLKI